MRRSTTTFSRSRRGHGGFTLLEVMVSVAILAATIVPMLVLREESYNKAIFTKSIRTAQLLAQNQLAFIALNVRVGEGSGEFEDWPDYRFEYNVTLYDFGGGLEENWEDEKDSGLGSSPSDSVFPDEDDEQYGPMVVRHVELRIFYPSVRSQGEEELEEYVIDTYMPLLLTEEQYERKVQDELEGL